MNALMNERRRGILGGLVAVFLVFAVVLGDAASADENTPFAVGRLWQVEKGEAAPSYVFGTFHIPDPRLDTLPPRIEDLVATVDRLVLELHPEDLGRAGAAARLPPGETLDRFLDAETRFELLEMGREAGLPPDAVLAMRPIMIAGIVSVPPRLIRRFAAGRQGVDLQLARAAATRGIAIYGLEAPEEQIAALAVVEHGYEAEILRQTVAFRSQREALYQRMLAAYLAGDILANLEITLDMLRADGEAVAERFMDSLLYRRNRLFAARLRRHLAAGNALIAVGSAHIPGRDGLLDVLRQDGYRITRLE